MSRKTADNLDQLVRHEQRRVGVAVLGTTGLLCLLSFMLYGLSVPRSTREIAGEVLMFQTHASKHSPPTRTLTVRTEDGHVVRAWVPGYVSAMPGQRVLLTEKRLIFGWSRYAYRKHAPLPTRAQELGVEHLGKERGR